MTSDHKSGAHTRLTTCSIPGRSGRYYSSLIATTHNRFPRYFGHHNSCVSQLPIDSTDTHAFPQTNLWSFMCGRPRGLTDITPQLGNTFINPWSAGKKQKVTELCQTGVTSAFINQSVTIITGCHRGSAPANVNQIETVGVLLKVAKPQVLGQSGE